MIFLVLAAVLASPVWAESAKEDSNKAILDRVNEHYAELTTYRAAYEQVAESPAMGGKQAIVFKDISKGELVFVKPRPDQAGPGGAAGRGSAFGRLRKLVVYPG